MWKTFFIITAIGFTGGAWADAADCNSTPYVGVCQQGCDDEVPQSDYTPEPLAQSAEFSPTVYQHSSLNATRNTPATKSHQKI